MLYGEEGGGSLRNMRLSALWLAVVVVFSAFPESVRANGETFYIFTNIAEFNLTPRPNPVINNEGTQLAVVTGMRAIFSL